MQKLHLASTSPRRQELLKQLGIDFEVVAPRFEESPTGRPPQEECLFFAREKALSVAAELPNAWILGCDTLIACEGLILGKPKDAADAFRILKTLSGKTHQVLSAVVLLNTATGDRKEHVEIAQVRFRNLEDQTIRDYIATGEPMGKTGAYAVQGLARKLLIESVEGEEVAVIGLPLKILKEWLKTNSSLNSI